MGPRVADNITCFEESFAVTLKRLFKTGAMFNTLSWTRKARTARICLLEMGSNMHNNVVDFLYKRVNDIPRSVRTNWQGPQRIRHSL